MSTESFFAMHVARAAKILPHFAAQFDPHSSVPYAARTGKIFLMLSQVDDLVAEYHDCLSTLRAHRRFDLPPPAWMGSETQEILENVESLGVLHDVGRAMVGHAL